MIYLLFPKQIIIVILPSKPCFWEEITIVRHQNYLFQNFTLLNSFLTVTAVEHAPSFFVSTIASFDNYHFLKLKI